MVKHEFRYGQYYAAKFRGRNGDLIVGKLVGVKMKGPRQVLIFENLLNGSTAKKTPENVRKRNKRISKKHADRIVILYKRLGLHEAREMAVNTKEYFGRNGHNQLEIGEVEQMHTEPPQVPIPSIHVGRLPWDSFFMLHAHLAATRSTCDGRGPELLLDPGRHGVGAVIVKDHRVVAGGYNGSAPGHPHCNELTCSCGFRYPDPNVPESVAKDLEIKKDETMKVPCPVCALPLQGGHLISEGHCVRTIHSEMNALIQCALDGTSPEGASLFCTASPCWDCAKAIIRAKIRRVCVGAPYESRYGLSSQVMDVLRSAKIKVRYINLGFKDGALTEIETKSHKPEFSFTF